MPHAAQVNLRRRLVLLAIVGVSAGCSFVDLCYLNPTPCSSPDDGSPLDAVSDASPCYAGADPCACLPVVKEFAGCGTVQALLAQSSYAYWMGYNGSSSLGRELCRVPAADEGGTVAPIYTGLARWTNFYGGFAVGSQGVYIDYDRYTTLPPTLLSGPLAGDGDAMTPLIPSLPSATFALSATPTGLYWLDSAHDLCASALDGGIAPGDSGCGGAPVAWAPDGGAPPLSANTSVRDYLAVTAHGAFQTYYFTGETLFVPLDGGAPAPLAAGAKQQIRPIAANDTDVVWSEASGTVFAIRHASVTGSSIVVDAKPLTTAASNAFAIDATSVYFATGLQNSFQIQRVSLAGGTADVVACVPSAIIGTPNLLAVDDQYVYFAAIGDSRIYVVPK